MKNYLIEALESNNTVIIPGLGALTITSARTRDIYFIPYLKHDDGTLNSLISEKTGNNKEESKNFIQKFVEEVKNSIDQTAFFELENFGRFKKLHTGDIEFEKWEDYKKEDKSILSQSLKAREQEKDKKQISIKPKITSVNLAETENKIENTSIDKVENKSITEETIHENNDTIENQTEVVSIISDDSNEIESNKEIDLISDEVIERNNEAITSIEAEEITEIQPDITNESTALEINNGEINVDTPIQTERIEEEKKSEENILNNHDQEIVIKSSRKNKKKNKIEESVNIEQTISKKEEKKKKNAVLPWFIIGIALTSGIVAYTLYSRENEKIIVTEKIIETKNDTKKEVKAEIVKEVKTNTETTTKPISKENKKVKVTTPVNTEIKEKKKAEKVKEVKTNPETSKKLISKENKEVKVAKPVNTEIKEKKNAIEKVQQKNIEPIKITKKENATLKPQNASKKELAEADDIVNQLNNNKKNNEAVNTIKNNITNTKNNNSSSNEKPVTKPILNNSKSEPVKNNNTTPEISTNQKVKTNNSTQSNTTNKTSPAPSSNSTTSKNTSTQKSNKPITGGVAGKKKELIAGTFKDKATAEKNVEKLKQDGYQNARIEMHDGQYDVIIDSYSTLSETIKELNKFRNK